MGNFDGILKKDSVLEQVKQAEEVVWINPEKTSFEDSMQGCGLGQKDIDEAEQRLLRFAPLIQKYFPETQELNGLIESPLVEIPSMKQFLNEKLEGELEG